MQERLYYAIKLKEEMQFVCTEEAGEPAVWTHKAETQ